MLRPREDLGRRPARHDAALGALHRGARGAVGGGADRVDHRARREAYAGQAALGAHLRYETLDGTEDLVIPRGTQPGKVFRLRGRGVPDVNGRGRGDLLVQVVASIGVGLATGDNDTKFVLASSHGYGFVTRFENLTGRNKAGKAMLSLTPGASVLQPASRVCTLSIALKSAWRRPGLTSARV